MIAPLLSLMLCAAPFPLPSVDNKPLAVTQGQKSFRLPMRFDKVRAFYEERFKATDGVTLRVTGTPGSRVLKLETKKLEYAWTQATAREGELETVVDLKAVVVGPTVDVTGKGPPVEFILTRSPEINRAVESIDHTESMRAR